MGKSFTQLNSVSGRLKRTLLSFDQIQRLQAPSSSSAGSKKTEIPETVFDKYLANNTGVIRNFLEKFRDFGEALTEPMSHTYRLITGQAKDLDQISQSMSRLTGATLDLRTGINQTKGELLWLTNQFFGAVAAADSTPAVQGLGSIRGAVQDLEEPIEAVKNKLGAVSALWNVTAQAGSAAAGTVQNAWGAMDNWFQNKVVGSVESGITSMLGGMTGAFNGVLGAVEAAVNAAVKSVNTLNLTIPKWIPLIGGNVLRFSLPSISLPKIPALAQGAVLPANQPFLAVVGDQRHGTNVEAPLSTIQEAVALVMEEQTGAILAGFEASVQVQREILEAVLGIRIGDEVIARASRRFDSRQAVMMGGGV